MGKRVISLLIASVLFLSIPCSADEAFSLDRRSALAGASKALTNFFSEHEDGVEELKRSLQEIATTEYEEAENEETEPTEETEMFVESMDDHITEYQEPVNGIVSAEVSVYVRQKPTTSSEVLGSALRETEITVLGEVVLNGKLWYHVQIGDTVGYAAGSYVLYGQDAEDFKVAIRDKYENIPDMPARFRICDDTSNLHANVLEELEENIRQINYCLESDFEAQQAVGSTMGMYAVLIYLIENYQHVMDLAFEYGLDTTYKVASLDLEVIETHREALNRATGQSDDDFVNQILQAKADAEAAASYDFGQEMANYAATFVGILPYVWGGASLTHGADCSGFVTQIYAHFGLIDQAKANMHGYDSSALRHVGYEVSVADIKPGDLVCYNGHVAMYYGDGLVVHEPSPGKKCSFGYLYMMRIITVRRLF